MKSKQVAVVVPIYRFPLTPPEEISLLHMEHFLGNYERILVAPNNLKIDHPKLESLPVERFDDRCFSDVSAYSRLMLSQEFYERFEAYEYILIYQLDCLVFSNELYQWCGRGWDYLGAPWFEDCSEDPSSGFWATGNGGLSLRRVSKFLEILNSRKRRPPGPTDFFARSPRLQRAFLQAKAFAYARGYKSSAQYAVRNFPLNEDAFWAFEAQAYGDFVIPSPEEALPFAFEFAPRYCFQANKGKLPFGCHAWYKTDPDFWRPFLLAPNAGASGALRT